MAQDIYGAIRFIERLHLLELLVPPQHWAGAERAAGRTIRRYGTRTKPFIRDRFWPQTWGRPKINHAIPAHQKRGDRLLRGHAAPLALS